MNNSFQSTDWRYRGQDKYLKGVALYWKKYKRFRENWDHDHCEFCWKKFTEESDSQNLHEGYTTDNNYRWVCEKCFLDFKELFEWKTG
ncbi:MAG: hypothetical protein IPN23_07725 [Elusimicrobia bacterium]|nr:hypothetical protein [Elusimicrobiota bacterium]